MEKKLSQCKTPGQRFKILRLRKGHNQSEAAREIGCSPQYLLKYESENPTAENTKNPKISKYIFEMARYLKRDSYWLQTGIETYKTVIVRGQDSTVFEDEEGHPIIAIGAPIITWDEAATTVNCAKDIVSFETRGTILLPERASLRSFGIIMEGCAMNTGYASEQNFTAGDRLVFDPDRDPKNGDFVLARIKNDSVAVFRQLVNDCGKQKLVALSTKYKEIVVDKNILILGVLCKRETIY